MEDEDGDGDNGDGYEHVARGTEALGDLVPLSAELVADEGDRRAPDGTSGERGHAETHEAHLRDPGGNRYESADHRQDAAEEHRRFTSSAKPTLGSVQVGFREQDVTTELLHEGAAAEATDRPAHERAEELSEHADNDHNRDVESEIGRAHV